MAELYPISPRTTALLQVDPEPGETHRWLSRAAEALRRGGTRMYRAEFRDSHRSASRRVLGRRAVTAVHCREPDAGAG